MTTDAVGRLGWIQVDCLDPEALAAFWARALGVDVRGRLTAADGTTHYVFLEGNAPRLSFQRVPDPAAGKNRLHLDLAVSDVDAATATLVALGAREVRDVHEHDMHWRILADPEGNQFCLVEAAGS